MRIWTDNDLINAIKSSKSIRQVLIKLGLIPAGGNYVQIKKHAARLNISTSHFTGCGWLKGEKITTNPGKPLSELLVKNSYYQSYKLKKRLFLAKIKFPKCEECGWNKSALNGRIPVELDHINGDKTDNRLENLRILCPNCHSLKETHRGKNKNARVEEW